MTLQVWFGVGQIAFIIYLVNVIWKTKKIQLFPFLIAVVILFCGPVGLFSVLVYLLLAWGANSQFSKTLWERKHE